MVTIGANEPLEVQKGEIFLFQVYTPQGKVVFSATLAGSEGLYYVFSADEKIRVTEKTEAARIAVSGIACSLMSESEQLMGKVLDVSDTGLGVTTDKILTVGKIYQLTVFTPSGTVHLEGEVRYCRQVGKEKELYRSGIKMEGGHRIDKARWSQLINSMAA